MARNRQKAKQRKAKQEANAAKSGGAASGPGAPPTDEGQVDLQATADVVEVTRRVAKAEKAKSEKAKQPKAAKEPKAPREKGRFRTFLRSSWAELKRVQWPDRKQLTTMTGIVIGFVFVAGAYLGAIDQVAKRIVDFIIF